MDPSMFDYRLLRWGLVCMLSAAAIHSVERMVSWFAWSSFAAAAHPGEGKVSFSSQGYYSSTHGGTSSSFPWMGTNTFVWVLALLAMVLFVLSFVVARRPGGSSPSGSDA
jgi:hypothetical protein